MSDSEAPKARSVRLRPLTPEDLPAHSRGCDDLVNHWVNEGRQSSDEQHLAWLHRQARAWQDEEDVLDLAVVEVASGEHVGVVGIQRGLDYLDPGEVNLTYALYAGHRGRGLATAAVVAAMELALTQAPVVRFLIRCDSDNHASAGVARRLGFRYVGRVAEPDGWVGDRYVREVPHPSPHH